MERPLIMFEMPHAVHKKLMTFKIFLLDSSTEPYYRLGCLKDSNAVLHYVDSDIFFAVVLLPARSKAYINLYLLK